MKSRKLKERKEMKKAERAKVTRITVSRLFNAGNYENVSYAITVDVPDGASASRAMIGLERILEGLRPIRNVLTPAEYTRKKNSLERARTLSDTQFAQQHGDPVGGRYAYLRRCHKSLREELTVARARYAAGAKARKLLDDLGGAIKWKDAKLDWDNNDCDWNE